MCPSENSVDFLSISSHWRCAVHCTTCVGYMCLSSLHPESKLSMGSLVARKKNPYHIQWNDHLRTKEYLLSLFLFVFLSNIFLLIFESCIMFCAIILLVSLLKCYWLLLGFFFGFSDFSNQLLSASAYVFGSSPSTFLCFSLHSPTANFKLNLLLLTQLELVVIAQFLQQRWKMYCQDDLLCPNHCFICWL